MKLKKLISESVWGKRVFGEKLPTIEDYQKEMNEAKKIDSRAWKKIKNEIWVSDGTKWIGASL